MMNSGGGGGGGGGGGWGGAFSSLKTTCMGIPIQIF